MDKKLFELIKNKALKIEKKNKIKYSFKFNRCSKKPLQIIEKDNNIIIKNKTLIELVLVLKINKYDKSKPSKLLLLTKKNIKNKINKKLNNFSFCNKGKFKRKLFTKYESKNNTNKIINEKKNSGIKYLIIIISAIGIEPTSILL